MFKRRRFKKIEALRDRPRSFANNMRDQAELLPPGQLRDDLLRRARQADTEQHLDEWANSSGLQPPK